jgi:hypothetical protein
MRVFFDMPQYYREACLSKRLLFWVQASEEDIKDAYERAIEAFRLGKHSDPSLKEAAESNIEIIRKAFEGDQRFTRFYDDFAIDVND